METFACPVCAQVAELFDVVDFNKNCEENRGLYLPLSGHPVYYARCGSCAYTYAPEFQKWSDQDFIDKIYNKDYLQVDPDYAMNRVVENAEMLNKFFGPYRQYIRHLDYGGGNGKLAALLKNAEWDSSSYDPFPRNDSDITSLGQFNLITAFEVFEHVPDPNKLMENLERLLRGGESLVFFSTAISDGLISERERLNWWYVAPRNGHIGIHSKMSLQALATRHNFNYRGMGRSFHVFYRNFPQWAGKLTTL